MKVNHICFCYRNNHELDLKIPDKSNQYLLVFAQQESDGFPQNDEKIEFCNVILLRNQELSSDVFAFSNVVDYIEFELDDEEQKQLHDSDFPVNKMLSVYHSRQLTDILKMMHFEFYDKKIQCGEVLTFYLQLFFVKLYELASKNNVVKNQPQFEKLCAIRTEIYANPSKRLSVKELASKAYLSVSYFQHLYKEYFHTTIVTDMIVSRIEEGKRLLISTNCTVKEVAKELNYGDEVSFVRQFRKIVGTSPGKYKEQFLKSKTSSGK